MCWLVGKEESSVWPLKSGEGGGGDRGLRMRCGRDVICLGLGGLRVG